MSVSCMGWSWDGLGGVFTRTQVAVPKLLHGMWLLVLGAPGVACSHVTWLGSAPTLEYTTSFKHSGVSWE